MIKRNEPEQLSKIVFKRYGKKIRFYDFVIDQNVAYEKATQVGEYDQEYIIYGKVRSIVKIEDKVVFINFDEQEGGKPFALVIFSNRFDQFKFVDKKIEGKFVLAFGNLRLKKGSEGTQMILNDPKFLYELPG